GGGPPEQTRAKVVSAARKALELDPQLAEAHNLLAAMERAQWQWAEAEAEYKLALGLSPNDAGVHIEYADWLLCQGRTEAAVAWAKRARDNDPLAVPGARIGWILFHARRYDEAIQELRSVLAVQPDDARTLENLGFSLIAKGQPEEAIPLLEKALAITHRTPAIIGVLVRAYAHAGQRANALRLLGELKKRNHLGYVPTAALATALVSPPVPTGVLPGVVADSTSARRSGAGVTVANRERVLKRAGLTSDRGIYSAAVLLPGLYEVAAEAPGFTRRGREAAVESG